MKIFRTLLTLILLTTFANTGFSQKLKSDGYKISLKSFEKRWMGFHGKKRAIYSGTLKVNSKDELKGMYQFNFLELGVEPGDKISLLAFKNSQNKALSPKLTFDEETNTFVYYKGTDKEGTKKLSDGKSIEEIVLSGMLTWLQIKK